MMQKSRTDVFMYFVQLIGDLTVFLIFLFSFSLIVNLDFQLLLVNLSMGLCLFLLIFCLIAKKVEEKLEKKKVKFPIFRFFFLNLRECKSSKQFPSCS